MERFIDGAERIIHEDNEYKDSKVFINQRRFCYISI